MSEPTADTGALSVDAATALLTAPEEKAPQVEAEAQEPAAEAEDEQPEASAETGDGEAEEQDQGVDPETPASDEEVETEAAEPELPAIDAPVSWDADAKARFAQLPPELQQYTLAREQQRDAAVGQAQQRAANAEQIASRVTQLGQALQPIVAQAQATFKGKWDGKDWAQLRADDPISYIQERGEYEEDVATWQRLQAAQQAADAEASNLFLAKREEELVQVAPDLCGPEGNVKRTELSQFLVNNGIEPELIGKAASAQMLAIAMDAMKYRALRAQARTTVRPGAAGATPAKPAAQAQASRPVRPVTAPAQGDSRTRALAAVDARLTKSGSIEDAVALLNARG